MMIVQVLQVFARKYGLHFFRQFFGVVASNAEGNDATEVNEVEPRNLLRKIIINGQLEPHFYKSQKSA